MTQLIEKALKSYNKHKDRVTNHNVIGIIDYTQHSKYKRFHVYDLKEKKIIRSHHTAHGTGSADPKNKGKAVKFSNVNMSKCSSIGAAITGVYYSGKYGRSLKLHGLESTNSALYSRSVVIHKSLYVTDEYIARVGRCGLSWGCPAVDPAIKDSLLDILPKGTFIYMYGGQDG